MPRIKQKGRQSDYQSAQDWRRRTGNAVWRLAPHALLLVLVSAWCRVFLSEVVSAIVGSLGVLTALFAAWSAAGAPSGDESRRLLGRILLQPRAARISLALVALFALSSGFVSRVDIVKDPPSEDVTLLTLGAADVDPAAPAANRRSVRLDRGESATFAFLRVAPRGEDIALRRGVRVAYSRVRPWRRTVVRYPEDFVGPVRVMGLLTSTFLPGPGQPPPHVRITKLGAGAGVVGDTRVASIPSAFFFAFYPPPPPAEADSTSWTALADTALRRPDLTPKLVRSWMTQHTWIRSSKPLQIGDSLLVEVIDANEVTVARYTVSLKERVSHALIRRIQ